LSPVARRELPLLALTAIPPLLTAALVFVGSDQAQRFIGIQLIAGTLFTIGSAGVGVTLSSLPLPAPVRPRRAVLIGPSLVFLLLAALDALVLGGGYSAALVMADLMYVSTLYRIPGRIHASRGLLLAQFLPLAGTAGVGVLAILVLAAHTHLGRLGAYRDGKTGEAVGWRTLAGAWMVSTFKDFFFRGHYVGLAMLGLAGPQYASLLRFLDIVSRPTDYVFQRLVDHGRLSGRLVTVMWFVAPVMAISWALSVHVGGLAPLSLAGGALVGVASGLVFVVKYLSFEQNSQLRHGNLSLVYGLSLAAALPVLWFPHLPVFPAPFLVVALIVSLAMLLRSGMISSNRGES
jgi:hypothetical protein